MKSRIILSLETTNVIIGVLFASGSMFSCQDKEKFFEDSPLINVASPTRNQVINDKDSVTVTATIESPNASVESYQIWMINKQKTMVVNEEHDCDCKGKKAVDIKYSFLYDTPESADLILNIHAKMDDGTFLREEIPFRLNDSTK